MALDIMIQDTYDNQYLGEFNLPEDGKDMIVKIVDVEKEEVTNYKTNSKSEEIVLHFEGDIKPMILSCKENKESIRKALGTGHTTEWIGKKIQLYRKAGNWFGKQGFAVRIREWAPEV